MTDAVCLNCGELKFGALNPCLRCNHVPTAPEDQARHLQVTDHYLTRPQLEEASKKIKSGEKLEFNETEISEISHVIAQLKMPTSHKVLMFLVLGIVLLIPIGLLLFILRKLLK